LVDEQATIPLSLRALISNTCLHAIFSVIHLSQ
jgi:hypothetical protein